jgi:hypothetical protein
MNSSDRYALMQRAVELRAKGKSFVEIGEALSITRQTASKYVNDGLAISAEQRTHDRERAIAIYTAIIPEAWERLDSLGDARSLNVAGLLNTIRGAQERIDKLTDAEAPVKRDVAITDRRARVREAMDRLLEGSPATDAPLGGPAATRAPATRSADDGVPRRDVGSF